MKKRRKILWLWRVYMTIGAIFANGFLIANKPAKHRSIGSSLPEVTTDFVMAGELPFLDNL